MATAVVLVAIATGLPGCSTPPQVSAERDVAAAVGLATPIAFRTIGDPADVRPSSAGELTLPVAVERALHASPDVQAALARVHAAHADARQARLLPNPVLSVVLRFPEGGGPLNVDAGLSADLMQLLTLRGRSAAADQRLRAAASDAVSAALDVLSETQQRYVAAQANDELLAVLRDRVGILDRLLGLARSRLEAGEGTRLDSLALEVQRVELQVELRERELARLDQRLALARLVGEPSGTLDWTLPPRQTLALPTLTELQWVEAALAGRPEVRQRQLQLAALGVEARLTRLSPFDGVGPGVEAERDDGDWAVGPGLATPLPLFDVGRERSAKARALVAEASHELTRVRRQVIEECRRAHAGLIAGQENLARVRDELIPLAQRRLDQAESQFRSGQADATSLLLAEEQLRAARTRLIELERDTSTALFKLQRAVGGPGVTARGATTRAATPAN